MMVLALRGHDRRVALAARAHLCLPRPLVPKYALGKGYQLTHSLIAIGRGEIWGVGLGGSVEKLHWLPEAHTDFLLAVIGEEFGLVGVLLVIGLFLWLTRRIMHIGRQAIAWTVFSGLVAQGVGIWMGFQAFINMGVNLGALPTKGLTLPLMSYGGSAIMMNLMAMAIVCASTHENRKSCAEGGHDAAQNRVWSWPAAQVATFSRAWPWPKPCASAVGACIGWARQTAWRASLVPPRGFAFEPVHLAVCAARAFRPGLVAAALLRAFWQSLQVVRRVKPDVVLGLGGYISFPGGMMGQPVGKPLGAARAKLGGGPGQQGAGAIGRPRVHRLSRGASKAGQWVGNPCAAFPSSLHPLNALRTQWPLRCWWWAAAWAPRRSTTLVPQALALMPETTRPQVLHQSGAKQH
jgi:hypothetical protein